MAILQHSSLYILTALVLFMLQACADSESGADHGNAVDVIDKGDSMSERQGTKEQHQYTNALIDSASPYLQQHAHNPVDWVEWSEAAFAEARQRNVPVLVSIGYSTCHWCHVMAHESFEDAETAQFMNEYFVCIKVDREQHPEVDEIYMDAVQALTGHGGWPLNAVVDHEGRPFFAGTYFPKAQWQNVLRQLSDVWQNDRARIEEAATEITAHLKKMNQRSAGDMPDDVLDKLYYACKRYYDERNPGIGQPQPKFPPSQLLYVMLSLRGDHAGEMQQMGEAILEAMQDGGIHDRVGGGFHRYSVDAEWRVPHFEKMLYDNAQLMGVYALAGTVFERGDFMQTAINTGDYLLRDMRLQDDQGRFIGYASAEDADDPGGEGSFYAWSPDELRRVLGDETAETVIKAWDISPGQAEIGHSGHHEPVASHIPHPRGADLAALAADGGVQALRASWEELYPKLRAHRDQRPRPGRDDKVLTDLNALCLRGFSLLARYSGEQRFRAAAEELATMLQERQQTDGLRRLAAEPAFITDYGHLLVGLTDYFVLDGDPQLIDRAQQLAEEAVTTLKAEDGGFYTTPAGRADLVRRSREDSDNAYPSGIHSLALGFVRLAHMTGDAQWQEQAQDIFAVQAGMAERAPTACATLMQAWLEYRRGPLSAVVAGDVDQHDYQALLAKFLQHTMAGLQPLQVPLLQGRDWPALSGRQDLDALQVLICLDQRCLLPAEDEAGLEQRLQQLAAEISDE